MEDTLQVSCTEHAELPFVLNLPNGSYPVNLDGTHAYSVDIYQKLLVAYVDGAFAIGDEQTIRKQLGKEIRHWQMLRTVVSHSQSIQVSRSELQLASDNEIVESLKAEIIKEDPLKYADKPSEFEEAAQSRKKSMSEDDVQTRRFYLGLLKAIRPVADHVAFLGKLNHLIRSYMTTFDDWFVEEVTLHQLARNYPIKGVRTSFTYGETILETFCVIGKMPPALYEPWQSTDNSVVSKLKSTLESGVQPDPIDLMRIRSLNFLEKGAFRSAVVEASATLDLSLTTKIRSGLQESGMSNEDITLLLRKHTRFEDRAKRMLKDAVGTSAPELSNQLWERVSQHRLVIRQGVTHSGTEPSAEEAKQVVYDFLELSGKISSIRQT